MDFVSGQGSDPEAYQQYALFSYGFPPSIRPFSDNSDKSDSFFPIHFVFDKTSPDPFPTCHFQSFQQNSKKHTLLSLDNRNALYSDVFAMIVFPEKCH